MKAELSKFIDGENKAITLMGMSGVGKTYLSEKLASWGWYHYSCDLEIGVNLLGDDIVETIRNDILAHPGLRLFFETGAISINNNITVDNLRTLSAFIGKLGNPSQGRIGKEGHGGIALDEFKRRQKLYCEAEHQSLAQLSEKISEALQQGHHKFVNDSTGSMCEMDDPDLIRSVAENSLIVYIKASDEELQAVIRRAEEYPKPLLYPAKKFDDWLEAYLKERGLSSPDDIEPDDFSRSNFRKLLDHRIPIYDAIADQYGVTVSSTDFKEVDSEEAFLDILRNA